MLKLCSFLVSLVLTSRFVSVLSATAEEWSTRSIYQVMTDRFATSDDNNAPCDTSARKYCGGSWRGITQHLDYIQDMGFDAIWISPVSANIEGATRDGEAFHGYWTQDLNFINDHFGTADDLKNLSYELHARDMFLMFDVVINHMAMFTPIPNNTKTTALLDFSHLYPFNANSSYHPLCFIQDFSNATDVEQCWLGDTGLPLPDINTEDPTVVGMLHDWIAKLISDYQVDGLRIDTVKHIRKDFWPDFAKAAGVFTMGEVISDNTTYSSPYSSLLDSLLDYPTWYTLTGAFKSSSGNISAHMETVLATQSIYSRGAFGTGSFLENHDQPRFQSICNDTSLIMNAVTWPFIYDGIPILYYGQEQGYQGGDDPQNREALWSSAYDDEKPLVAHVKALNTIRKLAIATSTTYLNTSLQFIPQSSNATMVVSKPPLLTLFTNAGSKSLSTISWNIPAGTTVANSSTPLFQGGESLVDILSCNTVVVGSDGGLSVTSDYGKPQVLVPTSMLTKDGELCPDSATGVSQASGSPNLGTRASWIAVAAAVGIGLVRSFG